MYDANEVAKLVVDVCTDDGYPVTNLKLQKVLYFMWLDWYKERGEYLFGNRIEAWHYGPAVPDVYRRYRTFLADPIRKREEPSIPESDAERLEEIARKYSAISIGELIEMSQTAESPWDKAGRDETPYSEISKELMNDETRRRRSSRMPHLVSKW